MDNTPNLALPYIMPAQAQKHVTHNEAIRTLDALVQLAVKDRDLSAPPVSPVEGDRYIVGPGATGTWSGQSGRIAAWQDGAWAHLAPRTGWLAWVADEATLLVYDGTGWAPAVPAPVLNPTPLVGINATADSTNRLAVSSAAVLLNHAGAGHQLKVNKNTAGDTASLLFQSGFSGRAEMGLTGDDDWHIKVSADGSVWREGMVVQAATGRIGIGIAAPTTTLHVAGPARVGTYAVAALPSAATSGAGAIVFVSNESGGAVLAFSDGIAWRRVTDRAVVT